MVFKYILEKKIYLYKLTLILLFVVDYFLYLKKTRFNFEHSTSLILEKTSL
jgi:hypothetical protein